MVSNAESRPGSKGHNPVSPSYPLTLPRLKQWDVCTVAGRAFSWGGLIEKYRLAADLAREFVAVRATHVTVSSLEREGCALIVIKERRSPAATIVAISASGNASYAGELFSMDVGMAVFALLRRGAKINIFQARLEIRRFVAIHALDGPVRTYQGIFGLGVIKSRQIAPGLGGVAGLATGRASPARTLHAFTKLPAMRILVTGSARQILKVI
jgi:hypothetical protein